MSVMVLWNFVRKTRLPRFTPLPLFCPFQLAETKVKEICLNVDVNIEFQENHEAPIRLISSNEWIELNGLEFFRRISEWDDNDPPDYEKDGFENFIEQATKNLRVIKDENSEIIGRVCIAPHNSGNFKNISLRGAVTVGGLYASSLNGIAGILTGKVVNTARDEAIPHVSSRAISEWASEQAHLVPLLYNSPELLMECAQIIRLLGGDTGNLPIGCYQGRWVSYHDIANDKNLPEQVYLIWDHYLKEFTQIEGFKPLPNIISGDYVGYPIILSIRNRFPRFDEWPEVIMHEHLSKKANSFLKQLPGVVVEAILKGWSMQLTNLPANYIEQTEERQREVIIGYVGEAPVKSNVVVVKKPDNC